MPTQLMQRLLLTKCRLLDLGHLAGNIWHRPGDHPGRLPLFLGDLWLVV